MAMYGVRLSQTFKFVSEKDPEKGTPGETVFIFKRLDGYLSSHLQDNLMSAETPKDGGDQITKIHMGRVSYDTIRFSISEVQNFLNPENNMPIELGRATANVHGKTYPCADEEFMKALDGELIQEMYNFLKDQKANVVGAGDAGKSAPQS